MVQRLLRAARRSGIRPRYLLLDRGFCSVDVVRSLQAGRHPFLMPLPLRGRPADHPSGPSGSRVFATARRSGWGEYTLTNAGGRRATVRVTEGVVGVGLWAMPECKTRTIEVAAIR